MHPKQLSTDKKSYDDNGFCSGSGVKVRRMFIALVSMFLLIRLREKIFLCELI
jgi:hypothetical protein